MDVTEKALADLGWPELLEALAARTHTVRGAAVARSLPFARSLAEAQERAEEISEVRRLRAQEGPAPWGGVHDLREALTRAGKGGALEGPDLRAVAETLRAGAALRGFLLAHHDLAPRQAACVEPIAELQDVSGPINDAFDPAGRLHDHASAALGPLRRRAAELHAELGRLVHGLLDDPELAPLLQDKFYTQRDERYVLPIKAAARGRVRGIVHGSSQSGQTVFVEPEQVVDLNNALRLSELEVQEEERRILLQLTGYVREDAPAIERNLEILERLDWIDAAARLADDLDATPPLLAESSPVALSAVRHPLLVLAGRPCVPIDLAIPDGGTLIVSGPNAGGKTVALKTLGLAVLAAAAGLHVPAASGSTLPLTAALVADIGDEQSLERNLSTFSAHVLHLADCLGRAGPGTLVLLDEIAVGTDPEQGAALAQAVLERLAERGATVLCTTHYDRLKALGGTDPRFLNASVGYDIERMEPTFRLQLGIPGSSGALRVARRFGLPGQVVARAESLLGAEQASVEHILVGLAEERRKLESERARVEETRRQLERAQAHAESQAREMRERVQKLHLRSYDEAVEALRAARADLEKMRAGTRRARDPSAAISAAAETIARHAPPRELPGQAVREDEIEPGMKVAIVSWGGEGTVVAPPARGSVLVQAGALKTLVKVSDLRRLDRGAGSGSGQSARRPAAQAGARPSARAAASAHAASSAEPALRLPDNTLDLRGERVDDAVARLDKFLDQALERGLDACFVLHGHGTGALRAAVREHLARHPAVTRFQPAAPEQGGDAVTAVDLA